MVSYTFYHSKKALFLMMPIVLLYPFMILKRLSNNRRTKLLREFQESLGIISGFLSAGYSVENAICSAEPEIKALLGEDSMMYREWIKIIEGMSLKQSLEVLLSDFALRSGVDDICHFSEVFLLAKRAGGNLPKIIKNTTEMIREKFLLMEDIATMNAAKRFEQKVMNFIPFFIILYMNITSPDFFLILYSGLMGRACMTICLLLYIFAIFLSEKIVNIEV